MTTLALIPLRGGSKSIPGKNVRPMAGRPLCAWTIEAAARCPGIDRVAVSTDSPQIREVVLGLGLGVEVIDRPAEFATDTASTEAVMLHAHQVMPSEVMVTLQATSPLTRSEDLAAALAHFQAENLDSMLTAVRTKRFFWRDDGSAINYDPLCRPRRQDFPGTLMENGAFYLTRRAILEQHRCRLGGRIGVHEMPEDTAVEIDEPADWIAVEALLRGRSDPGLAAALRGVRAVVVDVDGTLTDGAMYYGPEGDALKRFDTRDGMGIRLLREAGIPTWIITGENSPIVAARARKLGIEEVHLGVDDKLPRLRDCCRRHGIDLTQVAYVGDDINDLNCLAAVGLPACPVDAHTSVLSAARLVIDRRGGHGAVRAFAERLLAARSRPT